jgi:hypothetical protein
VYQITDKSLCLKCPYFGFCTKAKYGRRIRRLIHEDIKLKLEHQYNKESSQAIYELRKESRQRRDRTHKTKFRSDGLSAPGTGRSQSRNVFISQLL